MATGTGDFDSSKSNSPDRANLMCRDTMTIDVFGWAVMRFVESLRITLAGGRCIAMSFGKWEPGLSCNFRQGDDIMKTWTIPEDVLALCNT